MINWNSFFLTKSSYDDKLEVFAVCPYITHIVSRHIIGWNTVQIHYISFSNATMSKSCLFGNNVLQHQLYCQKFFVFCQICSRKRRHWNIMDNLGMVSKQLSHPFTKLYPCFLCQDILSFFSRITDAQICWSQVTQYWCITNHCLWIEKCLILSYWFFQNNFVMIHSIRKERASFWISVLLKPRMFNKFESFM